MTTKPQSASRTVRLYDTTLRDGLGMEGLSLSVQDRLALVEKLDELGVDYIEGGYPASNATDASSSSARKACACATRGSPRSAPPAAPVATPLPIRPSRPSTGRRRRS
jgi:isopropylmalate/homocitrate/citramalate synthase